VIIAHVRGKPRLREAVPDLLGLRVPADAKSGVVMNIYYKVRLGAMARNLSRATLFALRFNQNHYPKFLASLHPIPRIFLHRREPV
jgi:hypothetical protein